MSTPVNINLTFNFSRVALTMVWAILAVIAPTSAFAQESEIAPPTITQQATYSDLVTLAEASDLVIRAEIRRQIELEPERAPGLEPGFARLYIEARTQALLAGSTAVGEELTYLVDVPRDERGRPAKLRKRVVLLFADVVPGRRGAIQLVGKNAQLDYSPEFESQVRPVLASLVARDVPPLISGIRDALSVQGTLVGESETQIFLETEGQSPVSVTVLRRPGQRAVWGVSWGEIIDSSASAPQPETLRWYRLACSLPDRLPSAANLARDPGARRLAENDYALMKQELGSCGRAITQDIAEAAG